MGILCLVPPDWWRPGLPDEYEHAMAEAGRWPRPEEVRQKESKKISVTIVGWARNRFKPTNDIPPNPAFIEEYLSDAQQTADDARRKKAVRALHALLQQWKADLTTKCHGLTAEAAIEATEILRAHWITARGASRDFDFELQDFFDRAGRAIFSSQEPDAAMHVFWNGRARRGRRAEDHAERDYAMALAVQEQRDAGKSVGAASDAVGKAAVGGVHLTGEAVRKVYNRWRREVRAERALQALDKLWNSNQRG